MSRRAFVTGVGMTVEGARVGLQHNLGPGGACVVTLYRGPAEGRRDDEED
ncbi:hypothetical protein [Microbispora sp. CA-102843]